MFRLFRFNAFSSFLFTFLFWEDSFVAGSWLVSCGVCGASWSVSTPRLGDWWMPGCKRSNFLTFVISACSVLCIPAHRVVVMPRKSQRLTYLHPLPSSHRGRDKDKILRKNPSERCVLCQFFSDEIYGRISDEGSSRGPFCNSVRNAVQRWLQRGVRLGMDV